jgi:hypothetical protein
VFLGSFILTVGDLLDEIRDGTAKSLPGGYWARQRLPDRWGNLVSYSRPRFRPHRDHEFLKKNSRKGDRVR